MPTLSRRTILTRAAVAPAATIAATPLAMLTAITVTPATAGIAVMPPGENPRLVRLGKMLDTIEQQAADALEALLKVRSNFNAASPPVPGELVVDFHDPLRRYAEREVDMEGKDLWPAEGGPRLIIKTRLLSKAVAEGELRADRRTKLGKRVRRLIDLASRYEDAVKAAREAARADEAISAIGHAGWNLYRVGTAIDAAPALTMQGLVIKARAIIVTPLVYRDALTGAWWGPSMAQNILRVAKGPHDHSVLMSRIAELSAQWIPPTTS